MINEIRMRAVHWQSNHNHLRSLFDSSSGGSNLQAWTDLKGQVSDCRNGTVYVSAILGVVIAF